MNSSLTDRLSFSIVVSVSYDSFVPHLHPHTRSAAFILLFGSFAVFELVFRFFIPHIRAQNDFLLDWVFLDNLPNPPLRFASSLVANTRR